MTRLLLIDAMNLIRRMYEAPGPDDVQERVERSVRNAVRAVDVAAAETASSHVLIVFEGAGPTWRHALYPQYKGDRPETPQGVVDTRDQVRAELTRRGYAVLEPDPGVEADDVICAAARTAGAHGLSAVIMSTDRGFHQVLDGPVMGWDYFSKKWRNREWVEEQYQLPLAAIPDAMALIGGSNNLPGVHGIGTKKAAALLQQFGDLETLLSKSDEIKGVLSAKLRDQAEHVRLMRTLVSPKPDLALGISLSDMMAPNPPASTGS